MSVRRALASRILAAALALAALPAAGQAARGQATAEQVPDRAAESGGPARPAGDSGTFTVYLPQPARPAPHRPPPPRGESGLAVGLAAAVFAAAGLVWLGLRAPACPRCRQKLVRLERAGTPAPASGDAVGPIEDWVDGAHRDPWACLGCGVVMRRRFGSLMAPDVACPSCGAPTKRTRLDVRERPGYLTWGEVRLDEDCLSCSHRTSALYAAPPLEAPSGQRGAAPAPRGAASTRSSR
jgi:hypothetical protein